MLKWPDCKRVDTAVRQWAREQSALHPELLRLGYFGSYARGDWGVGSDLDMVAVINRSCERFDRRALSWDLTPLPVPAEMLVYTNEEWTALQQSGARFARTLAAETIWVFAKEA